MKPIAILALLAAATNLTGCAWSDGVPPGNPNQFAYVGEPGSFYDPAVNPPKDVGQVAYDPNQPLSVNLPANDALAPTGSTAPVMASPLNPVR